MAAESLPPGLSRIHVIGGPGTGKTTLARRLGEAYDLPVYQLDRVAYEGPEFRPRSAVICAARAREIAAQDRWVTEGIFVGWTECLLDRAETVVWLDLASWRGSAARIALRTFREAIREVGRRRGRERVLRFGDYRRNLGQLVSVLLHSRDFWASPDAAERYPVTREDVRRTLDRYAAKVVRLDEVHATQTLAPPAPVAGGV